MRKSDYRITMTLLTPCALILLCVAIVIGSTPSAACALVAVACDFRIKKITESTK